MPKAYYTIDMTSIEMWYVLLIIAEFVVLISAFIYAIFMLRSWLGGSPYVGTKKSNIDHILENIDIPSGSRIYDLGCGDGRFLRSVANIQSIVGVGIDINPIVIFIARFLTRISKLKNITFIHGNIISADFSDADILYIYMFPALIEKLENKILTNRLKPLMVISHGFKIHYLNKYFKKEIDRVTIKTYVYYIN
ncbi:hypothetical protein COV58_00430 [Candidatus Roizmanbacteria bacterium CG11_big_fil_rev_8_21_14_0_20_36_8]|uniref:Methyltransferase domain-containing protein n=2 Tax=Candidatus Roizmaniibacteriota TaxID=1752723 RepID=A0A2M6IVI4_9BACT|nr:MAG: hypothetical protein COV58_00430 [Candidatus Roizmanbacteria bacterium CG11_big_fil_rev_8_21_14_0_20_36_8]PIZ66022.1 MAG: hypothetical protein COY14_01070 [Candidatus Roizmanbacteria bacterium CG_4_10_14_0_2_um_filter_36_9]